MNNAEGNEPQDKQTDRAAESPVKTPAAETAHIKMSDAQAAAGGVAQAGANVRTETTKDGMHIGPQGLYEKPPRGVDVVNDDGPDDTVDADAKSIHARREAEMRARDPDSVINSNATRVNYVPEPGDGLGGFDSRPARNGVLLALERGYRLIDRGMVAPTVPEVEEKVRFEGRDAHGHTLRGRKHFALNHLRPSRLFELERK
ncbi:2-oxoglutarate dehydrogenase [Caballeronia peredens]|nr:2-oxoglutarate dehydrogenase [Caballeronia peredens]